MTHDLLKQHWSRYIGPESPDPHTYKYNPQSGPVFSSPFGPLPPRPDDLNIHELCFPPGNPLPEDYPLFINAVTEEFVTLHSFFARVCALSLVFRQDGPNPLGLGRSPVDDKQDGEIMALFSQNHIHYPMVVHACFRSELVFGAISPGSTPYELWWVLRKMQITSLMCHETLLPVLSEALKLGSGESDNLPLKLKLDARKIIVLSDNPQLDAVSGHRTVESLVRQGMQLAERPRRLHGGHRLACLFQSSGTSGLPKAMMITHYNSVSSSLQAPICNVQAARFAGTTPLSAPITTLGMLPMYHSYGMVTSILRINHFRNTHILLPKWDVQLALHAIQKYKITTLPLVPPLVRHLALSPLLDTYDVSSVVSASSGAAHLPPDVAAQLAKRLPRYGAALIPSGYGLSEAASIAAPTAPGLFGLPPAGPGTIGYLFPGISARIVDPTTLSDVGVGEPGEFWVAGPVVTPGYFRDARATADLFAEPGWLRTGDLVRRDEHDRIYFVDRLKEMIKVKGLQVAATEVEDTLLQHPEGLVRDACVAGVDNGRGDGSSFVRAWVVLTEGGEKLGEEVVAAKLDVWVKQRLSRHKWLTGGVEAVDSVSSIFLSFCFPK